MSNICVLLFTSILGPLWAVSVCIYSQWLHMRPKSAGGHTASWNINWSYRIIQLSSREILLF